MKKLSEQDCLQIIENGDEEGAIYAQDLLLSEMPDAMKKFNRVDKALRNYLAEVQTHFPDAQYYTGSGGFHLMLGHPHSHKEQAQQQLVALTGSASIGDGDF